jgi:inorganic triphosphatase YgiF
MAIRQRCSAINEEVTTTIVIEPGSMAKLDASLQTIKSQGADGSFRRGEWESEIKGDVHNLRKVQGTALEPLLTKRLEHKLAPIFETRVRRSIAPVRLSPIVVAELA